MNQDMYSREASLHKAQTVRAAGKRRRVGGVVALALAGTLAVGGTLAFLTSTTPDVTNTFTAASVTTDIEEKLDGTEKKDVFVKNMGDIPVYVRAQLVINWVDASGNVVASVPENYTYTTGDIPATAEWVKASDGFYYYTSPVPANGATTNLVNSIASQVTLAQDETAEYFLSVDVLTEAIQADGTTALGEPAVVDAWGSIVTVNDDKTLSVTTA